ncbi:MAG: sugar phosphate isomerase/epimerase [Betaproteobacteria bacterium]|nr:sugar phosphate isomerase/epimerase [Betaproteobacteria bacterium]
MKLRDRIGVDLGRKIRLEQGVEWAAKNGVRFIDVQLDTGQNALDTFDTKRCAGVRKLLDRHGVALGLHTNSAVNVAEYSPHVAGAVTEYLKGYVDIYPKLGAGWMVVHAGYHFSKDKEARMQAGKERLKRVAAHAERKKALVLLENLNKEPADAEVRYLAHTLEEWRYYWDIASPAFKLSFTANHAHLVPEGVAGFVQALDFKRVGEVRLADCYRNGHEIHLKPGDGNFDFAELFRLTEGKGFKGHYTCAFGSLGDMLAGRDYLVERARRAGIAVD